MAMADAKIAKKILTITKTETKIERAGVLGAQATMDQATPYLDE